MKKYIKWVAIAAGVIIVLLVVILLLNRDVQQTSTEEALTGVSYIQNLEKTDIATVEAKIKEIKKQERREALANGEVDIWQQFDDALIMGDSRAVGFYYHDYVPESRTFATGGATIRDIPNYMDQIENLNPSSIFLCYGLNDVSIGYWDTVEEYIEELQQRLQELHEAVPDATVYVNSIIPVIDPAFELSSKWRAIPDWNVSIKAYCEENNVPYIDITATMEEHSDLYDVDGIHVHKDFYPYWAVEMLAEVNEYEE